MAHYKGQGANSTSSPIKLKPTLDHAACPTFQPLATRPPPPSRISSGSSTTPLTGRRQGRGGRTPHATRRPARTGCYDPEVRKGIGAVLFALGIPTAVAGVVMTVVAATDDTDNGKYPPAFSAVGPVLLVCTFLFLFIGFWLISPIMSNLVDRCLSFDDPKSFCRVSCPRLSHFLKPDNTIIINRAAMEALKTEPGRSVLKRQSAPPPADCEAVDFSKLVTTVNETPSTSNIKLPQQRSLDRSCNPPSENSATEFISAGARRAGFKGVRFSESDADSSDHRRARTISISSDSSQLSLRHCKIHPKDEYRSIWYTDDQNTKVEKQTEKGPSTTEL